MSFIVEKYSPATLDTVTSVLADAFVTSPLHVAAFGAGRMDQNRLFFRIGLRHMFTGEAHVVTSPAGEICGYAHFNPAPYCLPAPEEIPNAMATLMQPLGDAIPRVIQWFGRWCHLDPDEPHIHLGPLGVAPEMQGKGAGTALMNRYLEHLKEKNAAGYLETDKAENVKFYEKFGFKVRREEALIGTSTWYMWREPDK